MFLNLSSKFKSTTGGPGGITTDGTDQYVSVSKVTIPSVIQNSSSSSQM